MRHLRVGIFFAVVFLVSAFGRVEKGEAHYPVEPLSADFCGYLQKDASDDVCQSEADPINIVFVKGTLKDVLVHFDHHLGWHSPLPSSVFYFQDHGTTDARDAERKTPGASDHHIRFEEGAHCSPVCYVLAAAHRDKFVLQPLAPGCPAGHVGEEFNETRERIVQAFHDGGHAVHYVEVGNRAIITQCDGSFSSSDGRIAVIESGPDNIDDNFNDNSLNPALWQNFLTTPGIGTVSETNHRLELTLNTGAGHVGAESVCSLVGDFDVEVSYELLTWPPNNLRAITFAPLGTGAGTLGNIGQILRFSRSQGEEVIHFVLADSVIEVGPVTGTSGKFRLTREGSTLTGYYNSLLLGQTLVPTGHVGFALVAGLQHPSASAVAVAFDNFRAKAGTVQC